MGGLENAVAGLVVDVGARGDADPADLGGEGVGQVVAVEVRGGDDVEVLRPGEHLLEVMSAMVSLTRICRRARRRSRPSKPRSANSSRPPRSPSC